MNATPATHFRAIAPQDAAMAGAGGAPLTKDQKKSLVLLARSAWKVIQAKPDDPTEPRPTKFEPWRHVQQWKACGKAHLTACCNADFALIKAHFLKLRGSDAAAGALQVRSRTESRGWALHKLEEECNGAEDVIARPRDYIKAIAKSRYKTMDIESLSPRQIWGLIFDIRRAAQRRRRSRAEHAGAAEEVNHGCTQMDTDGREHS